MIRKIEPKDKEDYLRMSEMMYSSPAVSHPIPKEYFERTFNELMRSDEYAFAYMLEADGKNVGYALLAKTFSCEAGGKTIWFDELFVLPEYRSHGLGKECFDVVEQYAKENGFHRIRLEVEAENVRALSLYKRLGYEPLGYLQMIKEYE